MDLERGFKLIKFICSFSENTFQKCHAPPPSPNKRKYPSVPPYPGKLSGSAWNLKCILWMTLNSGFLTNLTLYVSPLVSFNAIILT